MAVITISILESPIQVVAGIPKTISVETNVPATVFYTLDGTDPTVSSEIAVGQIDLPTDNNSVTFKAFATDGVDTSTTIEYTYGPNFIGNRRPHAQVIGLSTSKTYNNDSAFGTQSPEPNTRYGNVGGTTVESVGVEGVPDGYDGTATGTVAVAPDKPYNMTNYDIVYSLTNSIGESGRGIGNLPAKVTIQRKPEPPLSSDVGGKIFDPRAMVIIQDGTKEPEVERTMLNREFFALGDTEKIKNGILNHTTGYEGNTVTGSLLRPQYNKKNNTWTFYYRDSETNRWIISIEPNNKPKNTHPMTDVLFPASRKGDNRVFKWFPFKRSHLR